MAHHSRPTAPDKPLSLLQGVKILSFTQFLLGPVGVQYLADMGADVIKVEPPGSGAWERTWSGPGSFLNGVSTFFMLAHRNTRSLTLNLKHPAAQAVARRLVADVDVLVQNFRPGVIERFGLDYETVRQINPGIIYVSCSGYGEDSPYRDLPGQDLLLQALSGLAAMTGRDGDLPTPTGAPVVDQHGAALLAIGVLAALIHRYKTGEGQKVEITMVEAALDLQLEPLTYHLNGTPLKRSRFGLGSSYHPAPYGIYRTRDGYLALSLSPIRALREALEADELAGYEEPEAAYLYREEIRRILEPVIAQRTTAEWLAVLRPKAIWCAPVQFYDEVLADPAVRHLEPIQEIEHPRAGKVRLLRLPIRFSSGQPQVRRTPPEVGEHTEEILRNLGYTPEEIKELRNQGAV